MNETLHYDLAIAGGGPAGLSAAYTAAGLGLRTILLERLGGMGQAAHPTGGILMPLPGFVSGRRDGDGVSFPELELRLPSSVILGTPRIHRYISPKGHEFRAVYAERARFPVIAVDPEAFLRLLAERAIAAGAEIRFGTPATGLVEEAGRVAGLRADGAEFRAHAVIAAEGVSRRLCQQAGLYRGTARSPRHVAIAGAVLDAPAVRAGDVSQIVTFGRRYTSAPQSFGGVLLPAPGRAHASFACYGYAEVDDGTALHYLDEYMKSDPRIRHYLIGGRVLSRSLCRKILREAPLQVVRDGLLGVGDAVTPGGHTGILQAMYLAQQAAVTVAGALRSGDVSAQRLEPYRRLFYGPLLRGLEAQGRTMLGLMSMPAAEIDRMSQTLGRLNLAPLFCGERWRSAGALLRWLVTSPFLILRDWGLLQQTFFSAPALPRRRGD